MADIHLAPNCCRHFTGVQNDKCRKGVPYARFGDERSMPCTYRTFALREGKPLMVCEHRSLPTAEEIAEADRANSVAFHNHMREMRSMGGT